MSTLDERLAQRTSLGTWTFDNRFSYRGGLGRIYGYDGSSEPPTDPGYTPTDPDATTYIAAVEAADGQALEDGVQAAYDDFVIGCKADGIWSAIKSSCILAGARTLAGALVPLVGTAPTNFNFVSGDYNRKTGLVGDGSTKYLDSNRNNSADPQNNKHLSAYLTQAQSGTSGIHIGTNSAATAGTCQIASDLSFNSTNFSVNNAGVQTVSSVTPRTGFLGATRSAASDFTARVDGANATALISSDAPNSISTYIFCRNGNAVFSNARLAFYSIGESLDLAALDTRVSALITAIGAAIQ